MPLSVRDIPFFKGLSETELGAVAQCLRERSFAKGETLFLEGVSCDRIFFVKSGRVKLYRLGVSGKEQTLQTLEPGDTCTCNPGVAEWNCTSTAEAVTDATVWFLPKENYVTLLQKNPKLAHNLNLLFAERLQCFGSLIEEIALKSSDKRLVKFLLDMQAANHGSSKDVLAIPFTREELAQRIGMARETAARQLHDLKRRKLIDIKPHQIIIRSKEGLQKLLEK
jgi:CRP-like cAMP-binding protein